MELDLQLSLHLSSRSGTNFGPLFGNLGKSKVWKDIHCTKLAIAFYIWLHKFAPPLTISGDIGWVSGGGRCKVAMCHY